MDFHGAHPCELGLEKYVNQVVSRLINAIEPDDTQGEAPLLPILNRYRPIGTTAEVDFKTTRPCVFTQFSHLNQVAGNTNTWEHVAANRWVSAVNNWGQLGRWEFQVCRDPQLLGQHLDR